MTTGGNLNFTKEPSTQCEKYSNLDEQLYNLIPSGFSSRKLNSEELKIVGDLLGSGANPNYMPMPSSRTLVEIAIINKDVHFLNLLLKFGAIVDLASLPDFIKSDCVNTVETLYQLRKHPLQLCIQQLKMNFLDSDIYEMYLKISAQSKFFKEQLEILKTKTLEMYQYLQNVLTNEVKQARSKNKRLVVLIGEFHESINSILIEAMISYIFFKDFNFNTVFLELCKARFEHLEKNGTLPYKGNIWHCFMSFYDFVKNTLKGQLIPIDLGIHGAKRVPGGKFDEYKNFDDQQFENYKEEIHYRNGVMCEVSDCINLESEISIVGVYHLLDFLTDSKLTEQTHVVAFNASGVTAHYHRNQKEKNRLSQWKSDDYIEKCTDFLVSDQVHQATIIPDKSIEESIISPQLAIQMAKHAFELLCKESIYKNKI